MSKMTDLIGQKFGKLTAIQPVGNNKCGQKLWKCKCECGGVSLVSSGNLLCGHTQSCGCMKHRVNDLTGQKFGKLMVMKQVKGKIDHGRRSARWLCRCECGRETVVDANSLVTGNTASCGNCSWGQYTLTPTHVEGHFNGDTLMYIDYVDYPRVRKHRWWIDKGSGYFVTNIDNRTITLHNFLMQPPEGMVCDHINRNKLDNRRSNLRYATPKQNSRNRSKGRNNTSGYIGVCLHIRRKKYVAQVKVDNRTINLGEYDSAEEAAKARDRAALFYFGEFANLNFGGDKNGAANPETGTELYAADLAV